MNQKETRLIGLAGAILFGFGMTPARADDVVNRSDARLVLPASISRSSPRKDEHGRFHPPWKSAQVNAVFPRAVEVGAQVTVLPLKRGLLPQQLRVTTVRLQPAIDELPATWLVAIDASSDGIFAASPDRGRTDDRPFDAVVIYPVAPKARLLEKRRCAGDLPRATGSSPSTLWAAVDLDANGKADVAIFGYCCDDPTSTSTFSPCASSCERTFVRDKGKPWKLVHEDSDD